MAGRRAGETGSNSIAWLNTGFLQQLNHQSGHIGVGGGSFCFQSTSVVVMPV